MELFELMGKISIAGVEHAENSINSIARTVNIASEKISDDLGRIGRMSDGIFENKRTFKYGIENISQDTPSFSSKITDGSFENNSTPWDNIRIIRSNTDNNSSFARLFDNNLIMASIHKIGSSFTDIITKNRNNFTDFFSDISEKFSSFKTTVHIRNKNESNDMFKSVWDDFSDEKNIFNNLFEPQNAFDEKIKSMKYAVADNMPQISDTLFDALESIYHGSLEKWRKIGSGASIATYDMAKSIQNGRNAVITACESVADSAVKNLMVDASAAGEHIMNTLGNGIYNSAGQIYSAASSIANTISQTLSSITASINIPVTTVGTKLPGHAKGGIVTREHIARVGEDGAEAIIPLEKNTQWIDRVAERLNGSSASNNAVLDKLGELNDNIKNLKIYLDSGALVGEIAPKMDKKLGSIARLKRRGAII